MNLGSISIQRSGNETLYTTSVVSGTGATSTPTAFAFQFGRISVNEEQEEMFLVEHALDDSADPSELSFQQMMPGYWIFEGHIGPDPENEFWLQSPEEYFGMSRIPDHYLRGYVSENEKAQHGPWAVFPTEI